MKTKKLAVLLIVLLSIPATFFLIFMFGEVLSGDLSGLGHLIQALPFLIIIFFIYIKNFRKKARKA